MRAGNSRPSSGAIRGVIFDLGNVLLQLRPLALSPESDPPAAGELERYEELIARLRADEVLDRLERGRATERELYAAVRRVFEADLQDDALREAYQGMLGEPMPGMAELVGELRAAGVRVVGLTDISPGHLALVSRYAAVAALEAVVASCRTGHRKPEPGAYLAALAVLETRPAETLFVDDRPENVAGARAVGLQAVTFTTPEALRDLLGLKVR